MNAKDEINKLLIECGATLKRDKKHEVWLLPNGNSYTRSKTPSDYRAYDRELSDLKRALGITKTTTTEGKRREKKITQGRAAEKIKCKVTFNSDLADKLRVSGVAESALQTRIDELEAEINSCWLCRLRRWLRG